MSMSAPGDEEEDRVTNPTGNIKIINSFVVAIPLEPDKSAQYDVEDASMGARESKDVTCQVRISSSSFDDYGDAEDHEGSTTPTKKWRLFSYDSSGRKKTKGGDEFYIRYEEFIIKVIDDDDNNNNKDQEEAKEEKNTQTAKILLLQAVAIITDHDDGSYSLDFVRTPMNQQSQSQAEGLATTPSDTDKVLDERTTTAAVSNTTSTTSTTNNILSSLTVYFEYTNGIGSMPPPTKSSWKNGGYTHKCYTVSPCPIKRPPIRPFIPPPITTKTKTSCGCGDDRIINLRNFQKVFFFGDSTFCQFVRQRPNKKGKYYFQPNLKVGEKVRLGLNRQTIDALVEQLQHDLGNEILEAFSCQQQQQQQDDRTRNSNNNNNNNKTIALVVGSCLWDILDSECTTNQGKEYIDHLQSCRLYIDRIQNIYPNIQIIWKLPMAVHIHVVDIQKLVEHDKATATLFGINRVRYMSSSRARFLYDNQKHVMTELGIPMIDLFEATYLSSDKLYPSDGRHYRPDLNRIMLNWFFNEENDDTA